MTKTEENLEAILKILDYNPEIQAIFFTGDITHHCAQEEFDFFARLVRKNVLREVIVAAVPGNHDIWRRKQKMKSATGKNSGRFLAKDELRDNLIVFSNERLKIEKGPFLHFSSGDYGWRILGLDITERTRAGGWANVAKSDWKVNMHCSDMLSNSLNNIADEINDVVVISHFKLDGDLLARIAFDGRPKEAPPRRVISISGHCHSKMQTERRVSIPATKDCPPRSTLVKDISMPSILNKREYLCLHFDGKSIKTYFKEA